MADTKIVDLTELAADMATGDMIPIVDVSDTSMSAAGTNKYTTAAYLARPNTANTFTVAQTITLASTVATGLIVNMPTSTSANAILVNYNSASRFTLSAEATSNVLTINSFDNDANEGPGLFIARNTDAVTPSAGHIRMMIRNGGSRYLWPDASGDFRIHTTAPTNATDGDGSVVGTQTSMAAAKNILGETVDASDALQCILDTAKKALRRFTYKSGSFNNQEFEGVVTDYAPRYGMDKDESNPAGKSLNEIQLFSDLIQSVRALNEKIECLREEVKSWQS